MSQQQHGATPRMVTGAFVLAVLGLTLLIAECRPVPPLPSAVTPAPVYTTTPSVVVGAAPTSSPSPAATVLPTLTPLPTVAEAILLTPTRTAVPPSSTATATSTATPEPTLKPMTQKVERG